MAILLLQFALVSIAIYSSSSFLVFGLKSFATDNWTAFSRFLQSKKKEVHKLSLIFLYKDNKWHENLLKMCPIKIYDHIFGRFCFNEKAKLSSAFSNVGTVQGEI